MQIIPVDKYTFPIVSQFIQPHEEKCIFLSAQVRRESNSIFILSKSETPKITDILGVFFCENSFFHCFPNPKILDEDDVKECLIHHISQHTEHKIKCISGEAVATEKFIEVFKQAMGQPYQINHYKLMTAGSVINPPEELSNDDQIIRCTQDDMELLFPIQKKYLSEEVAPFGKRVSDAEVSIGLRQILKNQLCLALTSNDEVVAKANTNAIGINWVQLGGIYTHPLYRRNGYAWQLVSAICRRTAKAGKKTALFVKDINVPAMELYKKLGFADNGLYEICYY